MTIQVRRQLIQTNRHLCKAVVECAKEIDRQEKAANPNAEEKPQNKSDDAKPAAEGQPVDPKAAEHAANTAADKPAAAPVPFAGDIPWTPTLQNTVACFCASKFFEKIQVRPLEDHSQFKSEKATI